MGRHERVRKHPVLQQIGRALAQPIPPADVGECCPRIGVSCVRAIKIIAEKFANSDQLEALRGQAPFSVFESFAGSSPLFGFAGSSPGLVFASSRIPSIISMFCLGLLDGQA